MPQPDRFPPAVVNVRTGVGQRQRHGGGGKTQQRQGGGAWLHAAGGARSGAQGSGAAAGRWLRCGDVALAKPAPRPFIALPYQPDRFGCIQLQYRAHFVAGIGRIRHSPRKYWSDDIISQGTPWSRSLPIRTSVLSSASSLRSRLSPSGRGRTPGCPEGTGRGGRYCWSRSPYPDVRARKGTRGGRVEVQAHAAALRRWGANPGSAPALALAHPSFPFQT